MFSPFHKIKCLLPWQDLNWSRSGAGCKWDEIWFSSAYVTSLVPGSCNRHKRLTSQSDEPWSLGDSRRWGCQTWGWGGDQPPSPLAAMRVAVCVTLCVSADAVVGGSTTSWSCLQLNIFIMLWLVMAKPLQSHTSAAAPVWLIRVLVWVTYIVANLFKLMICCFFFCLFVEGNPEDKIWKTDRNWMLYIRGIVFYRKHFLMVNGMTKWNYNFKKKEKKKNAFSSLLVLCSSIILLFTVVNTFVIKSQTWILSC